MELVVCHLTRMDRGLICVAGIDPKTGKHVRPVIKFKNLTSDMLDCNGGCVNMAKVIDLGPVRFAGVRPELEDHEFDPSRMKSVRTLFPVEFFLLLKENAKSSLKEIFAESLQNHGSSAVVEVGSGNASLGFFRPKSKPTLLINDQGKVRLSMTDEDRKLYLSVTDLRCYTKDTCTPNKDAIKKASRKISNGVGVTIGLGLTRPWQKPGDEKPYHWLQVNNIHFDDDPTWQVKYEK